MGNETSFGGCYKCDIETAGDIQEALKDLLGSAIKEMMEAEMDDQEENAMRDKRVWGKGAFRHGHKPYMVKNWSTPGRRSMAPEGTGVKLFNTGKGRLTATTAGIRVSTTGSLGHHPPGRLQ